MKVLSLGLDNSILDKSSALARRVVEYGGLVEKYTVIVPSQKNEKIELSEKIVTHGSGGGNKLIQFIKIYNSAKKILREEKYDITTVQDQYYLAWLGLRLTREFKIGLEIQVHGFEKYYGVRKLIAKYVLPRANAVRCVSQRLKKQLINDFGVKEEKITVVPIFVDTASALSLRGVERPVCAGRRGNLIFLTIGRLVPVKNIGMQIEAIAEVIKKYKNIELWIVGDGSERAKLEKLSYELRVTSCVKFLGFQKDVALYYAQANAFLLASNSEGYGMAIIEAASFGLPIIMTDVGRAGELIKDGESGLVIPVGDKEKLAEAMLKIIEDENLRKKLGVNARLMVSRLPNKEQTLNLYKVSWQKATSK